MIMLNQGAKFRRSLLVSACFPVGALLAVPAVAQETVTVSAPDTPTATVNAKIAGAQATPERAITVVVTKDGTVTGGGSVTMIASADQGDGATTFNNAGQIGAINKTGTITDFTGVSLIGSSTKADNSLTFNNGGLITGGVQANNFGGTVNLVNAGTIYGGVNASSSGDIAFAQTKDGTIRSGGLGVSALSTFTSKVDGATVTDTFRSGSATVDVQGDIANADGTSFGGLFAASSGTTTTTIGARTGGATVISGGGFEAVTTTAAAEAGKTITTFSQTRTSGKGDSAATVQAAGRVNGSLNVQAFGSNTGTQTTTVTQNVGGTDINRTDSFKGFVESGDALATIEAGGKVTGAVNVNATSGNASAVIGGSVAGDVNATTSTTLFTNNFDTSFDDKGTVTRELFTFSNAPAGGKASVAVGSTGSVGGSVNITGDAGASFDGAGKVTGFVSLNSTQGLGSSSDERIYANGKLISQTTKNDNGPGGGAASATVASTGSVGGLGLNADGGTTVVVAGNVVGGIDANSIANSVTNERTETFDSTGALVASVGKSTTTISGKAASVTIAQSGKVGGSINSTADGGVKIDNAGTIGGAINANSNRFIGTANADSFSIDTAVDKTVTTTTQLDSNSFSQGSVGGAVSVTNSGIVGNASGGINANGLGGVTILNSGAVRGGINGTSTGNATSGTFDQSSVLVVDSATGIETSTLKQTSNSVDSRNGGNVSGTYSGSSGTLNFDAITGSIFQRADQASTVTISGTVDGNVNSFGGGAGLFLGGSAKQSNTTTFDQTTVTDTKTGDATITGTQTNEFIITAAKGGDSSVIVNGGTVGVSLTGTGGNIGSTGTSTSTVALTNSKIANQVNVNVSGGEASRVFKSSQTYDQAIAAKAAAVTTSATETISDAILASGGAASVSLAQGTTVGNNVNVNGISSAAATVDATSKIGGTLNVNTGGTDTTSSSSATYLRDSKGNFTGTSTVTNTSGPSAASGSASADVAGTTSGINVNATRGNATVTLTGVSNGTVQANSNGLSSSTKTDTTYAGKGSSGLTGALGLLAGSQTKTEVLNVNTATGGTASIVIDSAQALKDKGTTAVNGSVNANGLAGANVRITAGSTVSGSAFATSAAVNTTKNETTIFGAAATSRTTVTSRTGVGGSALIDNSGKLTGSAVANGLGASVINRGVIQGSANAGSLAVVDSSTFVDNDITNKSPATRVQTNTVTRQVAGANASVTNAAGATILNGVNVAGLTGSVTNDGVIFGNTTVGQAVDTIGRVETFKNATTSVTYTPAPAITQTYTINQNNVAGGISVTGATVTDPTGATVRTSNISATINLNDKSATLGDIRAQTSGSGVRLTNTTVNLNGSGFLGADQIAYPTTSPATIATYRTPFLTLGMEAVSAGYTSSSYAIRVLGVETLNKTGAGTFLINGAAYAAPTSAGALPNWTLDVGTFNVNGGEVQLWTAPSGGVIPNEFGIRGDLNNNAALVLGRRVPVTGAIVGDSLVGNFPQTISGIQIRQSGNFSQSATGTLVVGGTPSLVRFAPVVNGSSQAFELLGPISSSVNVPYFTTVANAPGVAATPSRVNVTGNVNLAGTVQVVTTRNGLYVNGDASTLFSYTGTANVSANVVTTTPSPFVTFRVANDANARTISLVVQRSSYATAASNRNAAAAASAFDSVLPVISRRIRDDANRGAVFNSANEIGFAQDVANIASALDFRLTSAQAATVFNELSSAEIYGSVSAINQNLVFGDTVNILTNRRSFGQKLSSGVWLNPVGNFARFGRGASNGASDVTVDSYGLAGGFDFAYSSNGLVGLGVAYGEHNLRADGTPEEARARTWTVGGYVTQGFGNFYANGLLAYGVTRFDGSRSLTLLSRTLNGEFRGRQFDASLEAGYDFGLSLLTITPYGRVFVRDQSFNGFTETGGSGVGLTTVTQNGGSGVGLTVDRKTKTNVSGVIGVKLGRLFGDADGLALRPYLKGSYTFSGDIGSDRTVRFAAGGDSFVLRGVQPGDFGTIDTGVEGSINQSLSLYLAGSYSFGNGNQVGSARGGVAFRF